MRCGGDVVFTGGKVDCGEGGLGAVFVFIRLGGLLGYRHLVNLPT